MNTLWKKTAILLLGFSNLAVLGTIFHTYFENETQPFLLFSTSDNMNDLERKIKKECRREIEKLINGDQTNHTCYVRLNRRQQGARYRLKTEVEVTKTKEGFQITSKGRMTDRSRHATEANFCNDCEGDKILANGNLEDIMSKVLSEAETLYARAENAVNDAEKEHNKKDRMKRMAKLKEKHCEGKWDIDDEEIVEYDLEERLECKMRRISSLDLPLETEEFYHRDFKRELWKVALSDDTYHTYLLEELLENFNDPYRYPFSVRASTGLMKNYLSWKDDFAILDSPESKQQFVKGIQQDVQQMTNYMTQDQSRGDLFFLNKGFEGVLTQVNQAPTTSTTPITPTAPRINYDDVKRQVKDLYNK